jgi:hypothetical protein
MLIASILQIHIFTFNGLVDFSTIKVNFKLNEVQQKKYLKQTHM